MDGWNTLLGTNISLSKAVLKMSFLFPRWDMLIPWRVLVSFWYKPIFRGDLLVLESVIITGWCLMIVWTPIFPKIQWKHPMTIHKLNSFRWDSWNCPSRIPCKWVKLCPVSRIPPWNIGNTWKYCIPKKSPPPTHTHTKTQKHKKYTHSSIHKLKDTPWFTMYRDLPWFTWISSE